MQALTILKTFHVSTGLNVSILVFLPVGSRSGSHEVADDTVRFCGGEGAGAGGCAVGAAVALGAAAPLVGDAVLRTGLFHHVLLVVLGAEEDI